MRISLPTDRARRLALLLGAVGSALLLPGGLSAFDAATLACVALWAAAMLAPPGPPAPVVDRLHPWLLAALTAAFAASCLAIYDRDTAMGTDALAYLKNAVALAEDDPARYRRWRGPLQALLALGGMRVTGWLLEGMVAVSLVSAVALVPLTGALGRRLGGPGVGLVAAAFIAGWADLRLYAVAATPYPLYAALMLAGTVSLLGRGPAAAGLPLGLAYGADVRALPAGALLLLGALVRRRSWGLVAAAGLAAGVGAAVLAVAPVELQPLAEQVALQRDLHAREFPAVCPSRGMAPPDLHAFVGPCGRMTLGLNLARGVASVPVDLAALALLAAVGLAVSGRAAPLLIAPLLPLVPSLFLFGLQHRYFVPVAPSLAVAAALALDRAAGLAARPRLAWIAWGGLAVTLAAGWLWWPGTFWAAGARGAGRSDPSWALHGPRVHQRIRAALREGARPGDRVVNCGTPGMVERLYPLPVENRASSGGLNRQCRALLALAPSRPTWLVAAVGSGDEVDPAWRVVVEAPEGKDRKLRLYHQSGGSPSQTGAPRE